jgi:hypothetical protein
VILGDNTKAHREPDLSAIRWSRLIFTESIQVTTIASVKIAIIGIKRIITFLEKNES